jgi:hypothetical protein
MHRLAINNKDFKALATDILSSGGSFRFIATGNSMWPCIRSGAYLGIVKAEPQDLAIGDVVLYNSAEIVAAHRIIRIRRNKSNYSFLIRGDGCYDKGENVEENCLIGRVVQVDQNGFLFSKRIIRSIMFVETVRKIRQVFWYIKLKLPFIHNK